MTRFVTAHERKALSKDRVGVLELAGEFFVKQKARELSRARALKKFDKQALCFGFEFIPSLLKLFAPDKVVAVVVGAELFKNCFKLGRTTRNIELCHRFKVGGVEAGGENCFGRYPRLGFIRRSCNHNDVSRTKPLTAV